MRLEKIKDHCFKLFLRTNVFKTTSLGIFSLWLIWLTKAYIYFFIFRANISCSNDIPSTKTIFDYDKDLKVFEALEERVEHSSFSSNNSSILRLLSSTPNKVKLKQKNPIAEENISPSDTKCNSHLNFLNQKLNNVDQKQLVLHDFLINLRKIVDDKNVQVDMADLGKCFLQYFV